MSRFNVFYFKIRGRYSRNRTSPIVSRFAINSDQLSDFSVPPDQNVILSFIGVQHDRRFRADPWALDVSSENTNKTDDDRVAFSFGARICGGKQFALLEMITILSVLVANARFELTSEEAPAFKWKTQLVAEGGQPVRVSALEEN